MTKAQNYQTEAATAAWTRADRRRAARGEARQNTKAAPVQAVHAATINGTRINALRLLSDLSVERARSAALVEALQDAADCLTGLVTPESESAAVVHKALAALALAKGAA